jgi:putative redox protein
MQINLSWKDKFAFLAQTELGNQILLDAKPEAGGEGKGPSPMELVLVALGGCTAMDIIVILRKKRVDLQSLVVKVDGERASEHPKYFTKISVEYNFEGKNLKEEDIRQAVELSRDKYCSVSAMLKDKTVISYRWSIINK